jgi:hypothetical protein
MMHTTARDRIFDALRQHGSTIRGDGEQFMAQCPGHDDRNPSLSIGPRRDGKGIVVHCHAGCERRDVLAPLNMTDADLFDEPKLRDAYATSASYQYPGGRINYRIPKASGGKTFRQENGGSQDKTLYLGDQLGDPDATVYVNEGEKAADAMRAACGVIAVAAGGATRPVDYSALAERDVVLIEDNDDKGRKWSANAAASLTPIAKSVRVVRAAADHAKADAADHIAAGYGLTDFVDVDHADATDATDATDVRRDGEGDATDATDATDVRHDGEAVLDAVEHYLARFVSFPSVHALIAYVLWIAHTHLLDAWESTPRIAFMSPEPASGKTRALEVAEPLVPRPVHAVNCTPAYLFRQGRWRRRQANDPL